MKKLITTSIFEILLLGAFLNICEAQNNAQLFHFTPQAGIRFFNWIETLSNGDELLEEDGMLYEIGFNTKTKFSKKLGVYLRSDGALYFGTVDYAGSLQDNYGNLTSYESESSYLGSDITLNAGYDFYLDKHFVLSPELGFQYEYWKRDIDNGGQYGYDEFYSLFFIDFGCNFLVFISPNASIFFKLLGEYPVSVSESINMADRGQGGPSDINLKPESNFGINLELGTTVYGAFFSFGYDYMLFSESEFDQNYQQPESERSMIQLKVGYTF